MLCIIESGVRSWGLSGWGAVWGQDAKKNIDFDSLPDHLFHFLFFSVFRRFKRVAMASRLVLFVFLSFYFFFFFPFFFLFFFIFFYFLPFSSSFFSIVFYFCWPRLCVRCAMKLPVFGEGRGVAMASRLVLFVSLSFYVFLCFSMFFYFYQFFVVSGFSRQPPPQTAPQ